MGERLNGPEQPEQIRKRESLKQLREKIHQGIVLFCREFLTKGTEGVEQVLKDDPDARFVLVGSHFSNLDALAAVEGLGDKLDIQITAASDHFEDSAPQKPLFERAGAGSFSPLEHTIGQDGRGRGKFNPADFTALVQKLEEGKTPWIAVHPFNKDEAMEKARVGAVYLAHKGGAMIIPSALEYKGWSVSLEGKVEIAKALVGRLVGKGKAVYHVGAPIRLPPLDVSIIEEVINKRAAHEQVSDAERKKFIEVMKRLREDADMVANKIGSMLPPKHRGPYQEIPEIELTEEDIEIIGDL